MGFFLARDSSPIFANTSSGLPPWQCSTSLELPLLPQSSHTHSCRFVSADSSVLSTAGLLLDKSSTEWGAWMLLVIFWDFYRHSTHKHIHTCTQANTQHTHSNFPSQACHGSMLSSHHYRLSCMSLSQTQRCADSAADNTHTTP